MTSERGIVDELRWENYLLRSRLDAAIKLLAEQGVEPEIPDPDPDDWRFWEVVLNHAYQPHDGRVSEVDIPGVAVLALNYQWSLSSSSVDLAARHENSSHVYRVTGIVTNKGVKVVSFEIDPPDGDYLGE